MTSSMSTCSPIQETWAEDGRSRRADGAQRVKLRHGFVTIRPPPPPAEAPVTLRMISVGVGVLVVADGRARLAADRLLDRDGRTLHREQCEGLGSAVGDHVIA